MTKRLFVGGLSYIVTEAEVKDMFAKVGSVSSCNLIIDKFTNQSKGFAFVEMDDDEDAKKAIQALNGQQVAGREIVVNIARPREERSGYSGSGDYRGHGRSNNSGRGDRNTGGKW